MFDGLPAEQLHQFVAASRTSLPFPLSSFPTVLHGSSSPAVPNINTFPAAPFDIYNNNPSHHHHPQLLLQPQPHRHHHHHHQLLNNPGVQLHRQSTTPKNHEEKEENILSVSIHNNLEIERESSSSTLADVPNSDPWSNDELLALLRIRSTMENWFPEFTWEHVSRKLAELGFKRSAEKCKEKFEEESIYFNNINFTKNYRFLSGLEELYQGGVDDQNCDQAAAGAENNKNQKVEKQSDEGDQDKRCQVLDGDSTRNETVVGSKDFDEDTEKEVVERTKSNMKKRKRQRRFEMLKGFCEDIVNKMMAQQEEIHSKLLEDMVKRNEEKFAREETCKKQEMDRLNKELEIMAQEQAIAGNRQATIIKFLKKFTSSSSTGASSDPSPDHHTNSSSLIQAQNPNHSTSDEVSGQKGLDWNKKPTSSAIVTSSYTQNNPTTSTSLSETLAPQSPSSTLAPSPSIPKVPISWSTTTLVPPENLSSDHLINTQNATSIDNAKQDLGMRWPGDEVLALINLRCSLFNNGDQDKKGGVVKAPLWEKISQGMLEMGYKRSAKRCKEKWENINKYFRKTKDVNKKRSLDSRTCPYFHQLSTLYDQGILVPPSDHQVPDHQNRSASPGNHSPASSLVLQTRLDSSDQGRPSADDSTKPNIIAEGEKNNMAQPAAFDFEF